MWLECFETDSAGWRRTETTSYFFCFLQTSPATDLLKLWVATFTKQKTNKQTTKTQIEVFWTFFLWKQVTVLQLRWSLFLPRQSDWSLLGTCMMLLHHFQNLRLPRVRPTKGANDQALLPIAKRLLMLYKTRRTRERAHTHTHRVLCPRVKRLNIHDSWFLLLLHHHHLHIFSYSANSVLLCSLIQFGALNQHGGFKYQGKPNTNSWNQTGNANTGQILTSLHVYLGPFSALLSLSLVLIIISTSPWAFLRTASWNDITSNGISSVGLHLNACRVLIEMESYRSA